MKELLLFVITAWKVSKYGVVSGPEITTHLDTFHTVDNKKKRYMRRVKLFIEESWDSHLKLLIGTSESSCYSSLLTKALADTDFAFS